MSPHAHPHKAASPVPIPTPPKPLGPLSPGILPRESDATPLALRAITKLDQRSMVWADDAVAAQMEAMGPLIALVTIAVLYGMGWLLVHGFSDLISDGVGLTIGVYAAAFFGFACGIGLVIYSIKVSLFNTYADLHFNRKAGKVYTAVNNKPVVMDWRNIQPIAQITVGPIQLGAPPMMSLVLVEAAPNNPKAWVRKLTVAGPLPNRKACQQAWELIRRYMEGAPQDLPPQPVVPSGRDWKTVLVASGPLAQNKGSTEYIKQLRANGWRVWLNPLWVLFWLFFWPDPVSNVLYARYKRRAKLPADLIAQEVVSAGEANPFRTSAADPAETAGMRHAARVIGAVLAITTAIGVTLWAWFAVVLVHAAMSHAL